MDYNIFHFKDLFEVKHGYPFKSNNFSDTKTKFHIMTPGNVKAGGGIKLDKIKYLEENIEFDKNYIFEPGDIFINLTDLSKKGDTLGFPAIVPNDLSKYYLHNQRLGRVINIDEEKLDKNFLFYLLCTREYRHHILGSATGSTVKHTSPKRILEFEISLPNLKIQKYIGIVLNSIDKKIENNQKIIANLEELSQTLFKRWFVDFEFPDENGNPYKSSGGKMIDSELGKIPKNWEISTVKNMSTRINSGGTPSRKIEDYWVNGNIPWLKTKEIKNNIILKTEEKITEKGLIKSSAKFIEEKATVIAMYGATAGKIGYIGKSMTMNQACCAVESDYPIFIYKYFITNSDYIKTLASGSAQQNLNKKTVEELSIIRPEKNILLLFEKLLNNTMEMMKVKINENSELVKLRDTLLPKLMSGEIEIPDDLEVNEDELSI